MEVYGEEDRPRLVAFGFDSSHPFAAVLERYSGSVHYYSDESEIRWASWDAVVVSGGAYLPGEKHLRVLQIGGEPIGERYVPGRMGNSIVPALSLVTRPGDELKIPSTLPVVLQELVRRALLPLAEKSDSGPAYRTRIEPPDIPSGESSWYTPLLHDLDQYAIAASYNPPRGPKECIYLPALVTDITPWLLYAFKRWSEEAPDIFPSEPEWISRTEWMTTAEQDAHDRLEVTRQAAQQVIDDANASIVVAEEELRKARDAAEHSERVLLTGSDDPLVEAVAETLRIFGFTVTDVDAGIPEGQPRKEDLRVSDGSWTAICEVKGYTKGAKQSDLNKVQGYATLFASETGGPPDAMWYAVNHGRETDPDARPVALANADDVIEVFADQGGLILDTRSIFKLRKEVESGKLTAVDVRMKLKKSTGRFH